MAKKILNFDSKESVVVPESAIIPMIIKHLFMLLVMKML